MTYRAFIESLNLKDVVFELTEDTTISYLVQYYAPFTGGGEHQLKAGTRFFLSGPMRDDAFYMRIQGEFDKNLYNELVEVEKAAIPSLGDRIQGFSFYITTYELNNPSLKFISGSRERAVEILKLIDNYNKKSI